MCRMVKDIMKNCLKFILRAFSLLIIVLLLCQFVFYPLYISWKWHKYELLYDQFLDDFEIVYQKDPASAWDKVLYLTDSPSIHAPSYSEMIERYIKYGHDFVYIQSITGVLLADYIYDDFEEEISSLLGYPEVKYIMYLGFKNHGAVQIDGVQNNNDKISEILHSDSFNSLLDIQIVLDENQRDSFPVDINSFHKKIVDFATDYFLKLDNVNTKIYLKTAYSSSYEYYEEHPYHIQDAFIQQDPELFDRCWTGNGCWMYSKNLSSQQ